MKMDDDELQSLVRAEIEDAISFIDSDIGPMRTEALDAYFGRAYGDEEDGRSQVVSRDVHDTIQATLPTLMRIFFGPEHVVEFQPQGPEDVKNAEQQTDYCSYIVTQDNDGFTIFYAVTKNVLREKAGFVKYWWDDSLTVTTHRYTGLNLERYTMLYEELAKECEEVELIESEEEEIEGEPTLSVKVKIKRKVDRVRIEALPPEEFLISRDAKSIEDARLVAHRTMKTVSELVAMGYDRDLVEGAASYGDELSESGERAARNPYAESAGGTGGKGALRHVLYVEAYPLVDYDDDGIAELRKVCTIGDGYTVVHNEPTDERPFADFHCDPEPHTFFGESMADKTLDVQRIKTVVTRAGLDSLAQNIFPRTVVVEGDGIVEDAMNTEVGAILRAKSPNGYVALQTGDLSGSALPWLSYMDELRENRTGMSKVSQGLDAEALQNTTATAAEGQFTRSQERHELIARIMASGMRRLYRGILRLVVENQRAARMVKLRNEYVPVDPRSWRTDMDVFCALGLGGGSHGEKLGLLNMIAEKQEQILLQLGPNNPLVSLKQYHNTLTKIVELGGQRAPAMFFTDPESPEAKQRLANAPPPAPDPKVAEAEAKMALAKEEAGARLQLDGQKAQMQAQADEQKDMRAHEREIARIQTEGELKRYQVDQELQLKRETTMAELAMKRELLTAELQMKRETAYMNAEVARETGMAKAEASSSVSDVEPGGDPG